MTTRISAGSARTSSRELLPVQALAPGCEPTVVGVARVVDDHLGTLALSLGHLELRAQGLEGLADLGDRGVREHRPTGGVDLAELREGIGQPLGIRHGVA